MTPEAVLLVHNRYKERGGEDAVFEAEAALLEARGHRVLRLERHNDEADGMGRLALGRATIWSRDGYRDVAEVVRRERPGVVHFHNTVPLVSPSAYYAARRGGAAVVQTLHNFRLLCPGGMFLRDGRACEDCLGRAVPLPGLVHACYRGSRAATAAVAGMLTVHRALGTWTRQVDRYIALSEFARGKFVQGGLPAERIRVKPGFVDPDPGVGPHDADVFLFVGRLSEEKGVRTLLDAWQRLEGAFRLQIVGDGALAELVAEACRADARIEWLGRQPRERVLERMARARALVLPSECYENFPGVIAEAYATGLPVIASASGSVVELVEEGGTGFRFPPGDAAALAARVREAAGDPGRLGRMGVTARERFGARYTAEHVYGRLMEIYREATAQRADDTRSGR